MTGRGTRPPDGRKCLSRKGNLDLRRFKHPVLEGTFTVKHTTWSTGLSVSGDGTGVVAHAASVAVRLLADKVGLTQQRPRRWLGVRLSRFMAGVGCWSMSR